jgi:hypothetical protein
MKKLTPKQQDLLDAIRRGVRVHYIGGPNAHYFRHDTMKPCTQQLLGLVDRHLVESTHDGIRASYRLVNKSPLTSSKDTVLTYRAALKLAKEAKQ